MSKTMKNYAIRVVSVAVLCFIAMRVVNAEITCMDVLAKIIPCQPFLLGGANAPIAACCAGARELDNIAVASRPDRRTICKCFKIAAQYYPSVNYDHAKQLPRVCHLHTKSLPTNRQFDCNTV